MKKNHSFSVLKKITSIVLTAAAMLLILTLAGCSNSTPPIMPHTSSDSSTVSNIPKKRVIKNPEDITDEDFDDFYQVAADKLDERIRELLDGDEIEATRALSKSDIIYSLENIDLDATIPVFYNRIKISSIENVKMLSAHMFADMNTDYNHIHSGFHCDKYFIVFLFSADISAEGIIKKALGDDVVDKAEGQYIFSIYLGSPIYEDGELNCKTYKSSYFQEWVFKGGSSEEEALQLWYKNAEYGEKCQYTHTKLR